MSDEEQDDTTMYKTRRKNKATVIRSDILHQRDFYCVGSNVWSLVSEKFGFDIELGCKVVSREQGILAINLGSQKVLIPATGRFDYQPVVRIPTDVVPDEEDDDLVSFDGHSFCSFTQNTNQCPVHIVSRPFGIVTTLSATATG